MEERHGPADVLKKWLIRITIAIAFIWIGKSKFAAHSEWIGIFDRIGVGQWLRYFTGVLQVSGGLLVLIPRTFAIGIMMLAFTMVGAMGAWIFFLGIPIAAVIPGAILGGLLLVGAEEVMELALRCQRTWQSFRGRSGNRSMPSDAPLSGK